MTYRDAVKKLIKESKLVDGQEWITLKQLLKVAKRLDDNKK